MQEQGLATEIARLVWAQRYRHGGSAEADIGATWRRVAHALAAPERVDRQGWAARFEAVLRGFRFLPGGRILAAAGTPRRLTMLNCFVMGEIEDSIPGTFQALREGAVTMQQGGGVGYDFSSLRPRGSKAVSAGAIASGPVSFLPLWDAMCATIQSDNARRGAMMGTLRCDHPDVARFITAKAEPGALPHFNLSLLISDAFLRAVAEDGPWQLRFPAIPPGRAAREVRARDLWGAFLRAALATGEPGALFIDRINDMNNLRYCETISAANPCGEVPLPPFGACDLGALNLAALVREPFTPAARLDVDDIDQIVPVAVRMLDNVLDVTHYPLPAQRAEARAKRRIGLGITGLADALIMLGLPYDSEPARRLAAATMARISHLAYRASVALSRERGPFPAWRRDAYLAAPFIQALPARLRDDIARHGIRNSHLLAIAPTGTISLLAGNVSSGAEPVFAADAARAILDVLGRRQTVDVVDHAVALWRARTKGAGLPPTFITAQQLPGAAHLAMQAALQAHVDQAISKTINLAPGVDEAGLGQIFLRAHELGLKGCTVFPAAAVRAVITAL